jgi:hypothetical protein
MGHGSKDCHSRYGRKDEIPTLKAAVKIVPVPGEDNELAEAAE